ncbi:cAMP-dependent protein kinase catalytic subunit, putative [Perkinsus marinus ATCC 50983]|uniref:cAMP-dependent protein kinase catalytic subunit, putative n=1 Tax=Perkinsus marinus (strain ATCC 50983 / TXsc) TaxID=423536 RepID=C5K5B5_PERM5|nr:cAMP-dependent protein kinase catalytic subunit, putative [Perkinsus marinus ATCC 50983]EER20537.1 cAMP-dependent protein kinase catalytic subunit, putative [Perkinsus marinus ATCC 50983]|eukprot:XP_002788741.1 cAMP-dependent protein kinase catalytic subunit, putative [Perkinsus marinus ATCC 50983]
MFEAIIDALVGCGVLACTRKVLIGIDAENNASAAACASSSEEALWVLRWYCSEQLYEVSSSKIIHGHISQDYRLESAIGSGFSGSVVVGYHRVSGLKYAIKLLDKRRLADKGVLNLAAHEASVLLSTDHPSVCKLHAVYETSSKLWLVMEYIQGKDLCEWLASRRREMRSEARIVLGQIIDALAYLHRMNIMHRDVKLEHFIIDSNSCLKLIDFGFATRSHGELRSRVCGTYPYVAPEVFRGEASCASDMWSAGIIALLMTTGPRHRNIHNAMQLEILSQKKGSPESHRSYEMNGKTLELLLKAEPTILTCPGDVPDGGSRSKSNESSPCGGQRRSETADESACYCPVFASFITSLLNANPQRRMTAEQARRHPWLLGQCCEDDRLAALEPFQPLPRGHGGDTTSLDRLQEEAHTSGEAAREVLDSRYYMGKAIRHAPV